MPLPRLLSCDSRSTLYASGTERTYFMADCPSCKLLVDVELDPSLGGPASGCTNALGCRCPTCVPNFLTSCCPFCQTPITMTVRPNEGNRLFVELLQPALWCRLRLAAPRRDVGQSRLPPPNDAPQYNAYLEIIKQRGYLSAAECYSARGQRWNGNLYWERCCPKCQQATQIRLTPLPPSVNRGELDEMTDLECAAVETFCSDLYRQPIEDFVKCPHCQTLLAITPFFIEHSGGLYMSQWSVASSDPDQALQLLGKRPKPLEFGRSGVFFNQFAIARITMDGITIWS